MNRLTLILAAAALSLCSGDLIEWQNCVQPSNVSMNVQTVRGCQDKQDVIISCQPGHKISIINAFFGHGYGRKSVCDSSMFGQNCRSSTASDRIQYLCQDKTTCIISPTSDVLGFTSCTFGLESDLIVEYSCHPERVRGAINIRSLQVEPNRVVFPGTINVSAVALVSRRLPKSTKLRLNVLTNVLGAWVPVPCISDFGSCTYENFCDRLRGLMFNRCDRAMENTGIPCDCPIPTGMFVVPTQFLTVTQEQVDKIPIWDTLVSGRYFVKAEYLDAYYQPLGCFTMKFDLDVNSSKKKRSLRLTMV